MDSVTFSENGSHFQDIEPRVVVENLWMEEILLVELPVLFC